MGLIENTKEIRVCVSEKQEQQDVIQFMEDLFHKCEILQNLYNFKMRKTSSQNCNSTRSKEEYERILRVPFIRNVKCISEMISNLYGH